MGNLLYGLNIAANTLRAQTDVINVTAHNIANANTPGYSRQQVRLVAVADLSQEGIRMASTLPIGGGVMVDQVSRTRNALYDELYRKENQNLNFNVTTESLLKQVEILFNEPSDSGFSSVINSFFNSWLDLSSQPESTAARQSLYSVAVDMTGRLKSMYQSGTIMREDINKEIAGIPEDMNRIFSEIADLNVAIRKQEVSLGPANDLRDKRDVLIDELTEYTDVRAIEKQDGTTTVLIGDKVVVERETFSTLSVKSVAINDEGLTRTVLVAEDGTEYEPTHGRLGGLMEVRDNILVDLMSDLNTLAGGIVETINAQHNAGYGLDGETGRNFFDPDKVKAYSISVSEDIADLSHIAASGDGSIGDNSNALAINDLKSSKVLDGNYTLSDFYNGIVSDIGILGKNAKDSRASQELLLTQIDNARETIKGVSIDEEMVQLIQAQRIYQSASKLIVVMDQLLEELINLK